MADGRWGAREGRRGGAEEVSELSTFLSSSLVIALAIKSLFVSSSIFVGGPFSVFSSSSSSFSPLPLDSTYALELLDRTQGSSSTSVVLSFLPDQTSPSPRPNKKREPSFTNPFPLPKET